MTARSIITWPDSRLLEKADNVLYFDDDLNTLALDMCHTTTAAFGAGLAATQIGVKKSICVIVKTYVPTLPVEDKIQGDFVVLVNPLIERLDNDKTNRFPWKEACLSVPGITEEVVRVKEIKIKYQNLDGEWVDKIVCGEESAIIQHEVDHLFGKLFIHRVQGRKKRSIMQKLRRSLGLTGKKKKRRRQNTEQPEN